MLKNNNVVTILKINIVIIIKKYCNSKLLKINILIKKY